MKDIYTLIGILNPNQQSFAVRLFILMVVGMLFEIMSIGLLIPIITLLVDGQLISNYPNLYSIIGDLSRETLMLYSAILLLLIYSIKTMYLSFLIWYQNKFIYKVQSDLSYELFKGYMHQPYVFHLQRNSAQLLRNMTNDTAGLAAAIMALANIFSEGLVLIGIFLLLVVIEPYGTLFSLSMVIAAAYLYYKYTKKHTIFFGEERHLHEGLRIQHIQQGLGAVKDIKLLGREKTFIDQYIKHNKRSADVARNNSVINSLPRLWLELIIIYGIVVLIFTMISRNQPMDLMIPTLGVFFASAFRLMPSINRILFNTQVLRYSNKIIGVLNYEISMVRKLVQTNIDKCKSIKSTIELINVGFNYENSTNHALYDINIVLKKGGKYGVIGPSGSGKSTLVDIVLGLLEPTKGGIYIDGEDLQRCLRCWQDQIGYVPQNIYLTDNTIRNNIAFGLTDDDIEEELVLESISSAQLTEFIDSLPRGLNTIVGENGVRLSGGQRQRIGIARALYYKPSVLIFDEASSALDNDTEYNIIESIKKLTNETVIIVAHRYSTVAYCDTIFRIEDGVIVKQGSPGQMLM